MPGRHLPPLLWWGFIPVDKVGHFAVYFLLEVLMLWPTRKQYTQDVSRFNGRWGSVILGMVYGVLIEILQETIGVNRAFEWADVLANSTGTCLGLVAFIYGISFIQKKQLRCTEY